MNETPLPDVDHALDDDLLPVCKAPGGFRATPVRADVTCPACKAALDSETLVEIEGTVSAVYRDGEVVSLKFTPSAGHFGYHGPVAEVLEGDEDLDVKDTDGGFWLAVRRYLGTLPGRRSIEWTE